MTRSIRCRRLFFFSLVCVLYALNVLAEKREDTSVGDENVIKVDNLKPMNVNLHLPYAPQENGQIALTESPENIGLALADNQGNPFFRVFIAKGSKLPAMDRITLMNSHDMQSHIDVSIFFGSHQDPYFNTKMDSCNVIIEPGKVGSVQVQLEIHMDTSGRIQLFSSHDSSCLENHDLDAVSSSPSSRHFDHVNSLRGEIEDLKIREADLAVKLRKADDDRDAVAEMVNSLKSQIQDLKLREAEFIAQLKEMRPANDQDDVAEMENSLESQIQDLKLREANLVVQLQEATDGREKVMKTVDSLKSQINDLELREANLAIQLRDAIDGDDKPTTQKSQLIGPNAIFVICVIFGGVTIVASVIFLYRRDGKSQSDAKLQINTATPKKKKKKKKRGNSKKNPTASNRTLPKNDSPRSTRKSETAHVVEEHKHRKHNWQKTHDFLASTKQRILEVFNKLDENGDGNITKKELKKALGEDKHTRKMLMGVAHAAGFSYGDAEKETGDSLPDLIIRDLDVDGNGTISKDEFFRKLYAEANIVKIFHEYDKDNDGKLNEEEFVKMLTIEPEFKMMLNNLLRDIDLTSLSSTARVIEEDVRVDSATKGKEIHVRQKSLDEFRLSGYFQRDSRAIFNELQVKGKVSLFSLLSRVHLFTHVIDIYRSIDHDERGIDKTAFETAIREKKGFKKILEQCHIRGDPFAKLDTNHDGRISLDELISRLRGRL